MDDVTKLYTYLATFVLLFIPSIWKALVNRYKLSAIPTVGSWGYIGALQFLHRGPAILREGCDKYPGSIFKVSTWTKWLIVVSGPQMIDELRSARDEELSHPQAFRESLQMEFTLGPELFDSYYHVNVIRSPFTRSIATKFPDIRDEIVTAFNDHIKLKADEWVTVTAYSTIMDIVCRTGNRMLVGLPLCRNPDYISLNKKFPRILVKTGRILNVSPNFLRPILVHLFRDLPRGIEHAYKHLEPLFNDRLEKEALYGKDWPEKPDDAISWLIDRSTGESSHARRIRGMIIRMLLLNFASIRLNTITFTYALFELATHPEYVQPMRNEIEAVICQEGWSKNSVEKLRKVDSFVRETLRLSNSSSIVMIRKAMKDFTFSNGMTVPAGNTVAVALTATHIDSKYYNDPETFDGFRFEKMQDKEGVENQYQIISPDLSFVPFGGGRHVCPGRFLAANVLKLMLSHVLLNYDIKMANEGRQRDKRDFGVIALPDTNAKIMFRKRA